ncbi:hypothetical protein HLK59_49105 [Streptomyces sp. S3(2020)]|uniref:hypothetical protein n=1 Tax=Streptomyces sp. S3(2020) TaxID=2732044 RepID=UPI0014888DE2|nr:hypothetical protein [Streptomyces sp. S3(2020)]NNN38132.1 hypothetical protein [Streptomyces sp. S3(2020)]
MSSYLLFAEFTTGLALVGTPAPGTFAGGPAAGRPQATTTFPTPGLSQSENTTGWD